MVLLKLFLVGFCEKPVLSGMKKFIVSFHSITPIPLIGSHLGLILEGSDIRILTLVNVRTNKEISFN